MSDILFLSFFRSLCSIFAPLLFSSFHACSIKSSTDDVITNSRQILHPSTTNHHDGVFLEVMTFSRNVSSHFILVRQSNAGYFSHRRIRLLWCGGIHPCTYATALRTGSQSRRLTFVHEFRASFSNKLLNCRHSIVFESVYGQVFTRFCPFLGNAKVYQFSYLPSLLIKNFKHDPDCD